MTPEDLKEKQFESDIERYLLTEGGYTKGTQATYDRVRALDLDTLIRFISTTQPKQWEKFERKYGTKAKDHLYQTLQSNISDYGLIHTLRSGIKDFGIQLDLCYFAPTSSLNPELIEKYNQNILECTRQFVYSKDVKNSIDMVLSLNGIPIIAIELKNQFTGQDINDSKEQWMKNREPKEPLFHYDNRILAYFGCDLYEAAVTTRLEKDKTFFIPFNQGSNGAGNVGGAGNPEAKDGDYVTSYLWKNVLRRDMLLAILQRYIMRQKEETISLIVDKHGNEKEITKTTEKIIFPRYHQLDVVEKLIHDTEEKGSGHNYLIQHSAGSGKSNSIAWLTYRLASLHDKDNANIFKGVFVITDRRVLNRQLQETILGFEHVEGTVTTITEKDHDASKKLRDAINAEHTGIVITTLQRFPQIYEQIVSNSGHKYAVVVDEAHSSQSGKSAEKLKAALADTDEALKEMAEWEDKTVEEVEAEKDRLMLDLLSQGQHNNLAFYAFTATPKPKTLQTFGIFEQRMKGMEDESRYVAYHNYSMLQAIEEGFIKDVLKNYTTFQTSYEIARQSEDNPNYEETPATRALKAFHDNHSDTINKKTAIIVNKFLEVTMNKMEGKAKAMVVTASRAHAVRYFFAIKEYCRKNNINCLHPMVAFSGKVNYKGTEYTEPQLNKRGEKNISEDKLPLYFSSEFYNMLIVADKYQTGFDEPLLHTMFVDKKLKNVKAVQTLSRLNRANRLKKDTFVFDFANTAEEIATSFKPFYEGTELIKPVDVNYVYKFHKDVELFHLWTTEDEEKFYEVFAETKKNKNQLGILSSMLKPVVDRIGELEEEKRFEVRSKIKNFVRFYSYMTQIARTFDRALYKTYLFADYLYRVLPKTAHEQIDLDKKVRLVNNTIKANETINIGLDDGEKKPLKGENPGAAVKPDDNKDLLDNIIDKVNIMFRGEFSEADRVMVEGIFDHIQKVATKKIQKQAVGNDENQFVESIFPDIFGKAAQKCYTTQTDAYRKLFENQEFYKTLMQQMGHAIYERYREQEAKAYTIENLQGKIIPLLREDFAGIAGIGRTLEEAFEWMIKVLKVDSIEKYSGLGETVLNALFKLYCCPNTLTLTEKRTYLKTLVTGYESYLKKLHYLIYDKEVTDKNGDTEHAALSNAIYCMKLNKLKYSEKATDQKFATYVDLIVKLRNDENHQAKSLDAKEVKLGIHVATAMLMYVTFKYITELEMVESKFESK